ncbi:hypothetical protein N657DRAFT_662121 [Parathielavia appendiculata]|uniref:Jacalin-type lectin domain-containing protein n=1 Tax=Parathielavia appendiculata TaxID=2587402 RepID=A0AAN6U371_9PEZI|nr:hypothetical protein N657DRAFT_662121 [Parathielavia appendiculata]
MAAINALAAGPLAALLAALSAVFSAFSSAASAVIALSVLVGLSLFSASGARGLWFRSSARRCSWGLILLIVLLGLVGSVLGSRWDRGLLVRPTGIGAPNGGAPFTILGSAGSSVRRLRVYRNNGKDGYLRGIVAFFSDGTDQRGGVRKDQFAELALDDGEVITGMTLWSSSASGFSRGSSVSHVARIDVTTSARSWGYGADNTAKLSAKAVSVGSGVLVGFQGRAGDDLDQLAPIFLKPLSGSRVDEIVFDPIGGSDGLRLVTLREGSALWNGTDYSWTFSGSESREASTSFIMGFSGSLSVGTTFSAAFPRIVTAGMNAGWTSGNTESRDRKSGTAASLSWSTSIDLTVDNPAVQCSAMVWEGRLNIGWSGVQTVTADGASMSFPVLGTVQHVAYGKVETVCSPLVVDSKRAAKRWAA